ncbi:MAG: hypothetical protein M3315_09730 [Actinomycetota bacterium]|nr:hypothetical protein [Actinomycetota bacterium]
MTEGIPKRVWVIGKVRELGEYSTPIAGIGETGEQVGLAPLTVLDADGERVMPVYSTLDNARKGIENLMSEEEKGEGVGCTLVGFEDLFRTMRQEVEGVPSVAYLGIDMMGEPGGQYAAVRL